MIRRFVERNFLTRDLPDVEANLLNLVRQYMTSADIDLVNRALRLARETCQGVSGSRPLPPMEHALAVTTILAETHIDAVGVAAGLVFEAVDAELLPIERVEHTLGMPTARIVGSMLRLNILERKKQSVSMGAAQSAQAEREDTGSVPAIDTKKPRLREALRRQQAETVRKMFVAMADDPRVVVLKLAYRLHAMRLMCRPDYEGDKQEVLLTAQETREIYAPLAGRLGMSRMESELQDLAFQVLEPERCQWVRDIIESESKQWRVYVERVCEILRKEMKSIGVKAQVSGRVKHLYSFYRKLVRTAGDVEDFEQLKAAADVNQIHDLIAFRILVDTTNDCYVVLGHVHGLWKPKEGRIKDYIANPKPNGYRALHTTVFCLDNHLVEIQIRTHEMHEMAEYGVAMHWHYKDIGDHATASAKELLTWLRQLSEWQRDIRATNTSDAEFVEAVKGDIFDEQIFVFTPKGEVKELPVGSTPLDFAYRIHSMVGDRCAGARIISEGSDGDRLVTRMVPLNYELKSGEIVDIVTNRTAHPTRDWLSFAHTAAARSKIRRYLKTFEREINIQIGRERLERDVKALGPRGLESLSEEMENRLCSEFHLDSFEDLLAAVGADDIRPHAVAVKLGDWQTREGKDGREAAQAKDDDATLVLPAVSSKQSTAARLQVAGVEGLLTRLANCCCPLPTDEIVGFVSRGKGVIVHRTDCPNIKRLREKERERLINVNWAGMNQQRYLAPIVIRAHDRPGLIRDIATVVLDAGVNLVSVGTHVNRLRETIVHATLELDNLDQMQHLLNRIARVKDVTGVERDLGSKKKAD
ncbi:MAG: bifunctional (p)ppGpp synthetase/guanosine-3',5'-bis(diphosphate) 3'-pyrophosphohydrolase [Ktedonobacteraceae bacterium]|nr:bifunctional (p)ppGpp synthetase/guanosine-3',5'-bis(diphosphate) 3'-pyrophosphohydrolase [Ktedonobacteraceae bacterium]MBO0790731.1 bifunctional (p)ppGpp synthetase/guanosine-3',5'-bis(diphosphate) 3'-pyrophosphohydrolase [Ktedonobacteraceae bacterium]